MAYPTPLCAVPRELNSSISILSTPFKRVGLFQIGARASFVSLPSSNSVVVIAPVPYGDDSAAIVGSRDVKFLIAPDLEHHMALKSWKDKYPSAKVIGAEGLRARKASQGVEVDYEIKLANKVISPSEAGIDDAELNEVFKFVYLPSHQSKELVTYHVPTKTLIEADLLFNLPAIEQYSKSPTNPKSGFTRLFNAFHPESSWHKRMVSGALKDKAGAKIALNAIQSLDFETIIPCHGDVITADAKKKFNTLFSNLM
ncbi:hypothetical protein POJ06DRAFT_212793 [Lipomyces tetrasporus]|uniref:Uncharacterized protein n=1 Tax=Lipomyces tetrasporus TaxID=54092 RepID=A0AAD7QP10_9ASCO|nr:uncharacterized protein POJ06DRAFT_212793 [Lipomyces tetrasporus]KAJ8098658.1 hypothetical protein POJ06DRAFT_212793 [Lipomyces tetrasporus]